MYNIGQAILSQVESSTQRRSSMFFGNFFFTSSQAPEGRGDIPFKKNPKMLILAFKAANNEVSLPPN